MKNRLGTLTDQNIALKDQIQLSQQLAMVASNLEYMKVGLIGTKTTIESSGVVYWSQNVGELYFILNDPPKLGNDQDLQLWAIKDGRPYDVGVIKFNEAPIIQMKSVKEAQAFAVTVEPLGGSKDPTLDNLILSGQITM